jgi:hypothetical protein
MSEAAKWRLVGSMSHTLYEKGQWTWRDHTGGTCSARVEVLRYPDFLEALIIDKVTHVYGPIADAPKPPPKLRRFTAKHNEYGTVSGVFTVNENNGNRLRYGVHFFNDMGAVEFRWCIESQLSDIQWLDKE